MSDIEIDTAAVREHARMVDEAAGMCEEAVAAACHVDLHDEVYGVLCSPLALPFINPLQDWATRELRTGAEATAHLAGLLREVAASNDATDSAAAQRFREGR